jgi:hypothetical protein
MGRRNGRRYLKPSLAADNPQYIDGQTYPGLQQPLWSPPHVPQHLYTPTNITEQSSFVLVFQLSIAVPLRGGQRNGVSGATHTAFAFLPPRTHTR